MLLATSISRVALRYVKDLAYLASDFSDNTKDPLLVSAAEM